MLASAKRSQQEKNSPGTAERRGPKERPMPRLTTQRHIAVRISVHGLYVCVSSFKAVTKGRRGPATTSPLTITIMQTVQVKRRLTANGTVLRQAHSR